MVAPDVDVVNTQQTPNPAAHPPADVPPLELHSLDVKQVPLRLPDDEPELKEWAQEKLFKKKVLKRI